MQHFNQAEEIATQRRFFLTLVDIIDGITPEQGETGGQPKISVNNVDFVDTTFTLVRIEDGDYYVELTTEELNNLGKFWIKYGDGVTGNTAIFRDVGFVQASSTISFNELRSLILENGNKIDFMSQQLRNLFFDRKELGDLKIE